MVCEVESVLEPASLANRTFEAVGRWRNIGTLPQVVYQSETRQQAAQSFEIDNSPLSTSGTSVNKPRVRDV